MTTRAYILYGLLLLALLAAGAGALYLKWSVAVTVVPAKRGPAVQAVYATGEVEPVLWSKVAPTTTGRLVDIGARDGDEVKAGEVLARLDDREARARLEELEAVEAFRRDELERYASLAKTSAASRQAFERAASEYAGASAAVTAARQRLRDLTLVAPMKGTVLRQDGEVGEVVEPGDVLFWIGQCCELRITAQVDEEDIPQVQPGQLALIKADAFPGRVLHGEVAEITPKGDPISKNYRVRIALPRDTPLLVGMTTEVNIVTRERADALLVPAGSVRDGGLWIAEDGRAKRRYVTVGIAGDEMTEIVEGLAPGELVVLDPPDDLEEGARLRLREGS